MKTRSAEVLVASPDRNFVTFSSSERYLDFAPMHPGKAPGLGVDLDLARHGKRPYAPAYFPVARKLDGTLHSW